ncbi:iron complex transport system ATP-binding protein [Ferrimonas sediminum]|uniref:Iron complex transport system ATP-binding protein n=1 Tax=Ferrimonas sediminum TaxID=718193 RepID=A0A1G8WLC1_9GAMM|nr:ABC transporter ATP-binding protein [Ferrimonas sediminum]SDJ78843.1 iron complex transport system ATP-binding protein [Ferrimonas sediminum]
MAEIRVDLLVYRRDQFSLEVDELVIRPGEKVALMGENGCGKSTLLGLLSGLLTPQSGTIEYGGRPLAQLGFPQRSTLFSLLSQSSDIAFPFTVAEVALMGRFAHLKGGQYSDEDRRQTRELLALLDVLRYQDRGYGELSGGEQRRVMMARVLNQATPIVYLDEPNSSLDVRHTLQIFSHLAQLEATVVTSVHDINLAHRHFDRFLFFKAGRLLHDVPRRDVTPQLLSEVYDVSVSLGTDSFSFRC